MKLRRRPLWALVLGLPLVALFLWMRAAASWRPVKVGRVAEPDDGCSSVSASSSRVFACGFWFDPASGALQRDHSPGNKRVGSDDGFNWTLTTSVNDPQTLQVVDEAGRKRVYRRQGITVDSLTELGVRVRPQQNRVVLLSTGQVLEWNFQTQKLQHKLEKQGSSVMALSRDARTFVLNDYETTFFCDARSGQVKRSVPLKVERALEYTHLSPSGSYALLDSDNSTIRVVDTATGKLLWTFPGGLGVAWVISNDEKVLFTAIGSEWRVQDPRTGRVLCRLPRVPGEENAALSPDSATLYSVANGVLYRQRAR